MKPNKPTLRTRRNRKKRKSSLGKDLFSKTEGLLSVDLYLTRRYCGHTQRAVATALGICRSAISDFERNRRIPGPDVLYRIAFYVYSNQEKVELARKGIF